MNSNVFIEQIQDYERTLYSIGWSMLSNDEDCADAVQETIMKAWKNRGSLKNERWFKTWITRIMINTCKDMLRRRQKVQWIPIDKLDLSAPETEVDDGEINKAFSTRPEDQKLIMILRYQEGYKIREISDMLSIPMGTVTTRIKRSKSYLKRMLTL